MRLSEYEHQILTKHCNALFPHSHLYLFGSRTDDTKRGGDIDLYLETDDKTDLFKALDYIKPFEPASIHLACAYSSSRMDHTLNNLRALRVFYQKNCPIYFYTEHQKIFFAQNETLYLTGTIGDTVGIMSFPEAAFTSIGLTYNGHHFPLSFGFSESVANSFASTKAEIQIKGEALVILNNNL